ncbi:hypothetical protein BpHYR1_023747 [Brachionus plicatilis]|uniref:Uncharacterized protein n=1 Tax=Brachionus plicatilis TaxID=10195 RepID=A0A3M7RR20_BRAPC|nr:hypothetical protein BpHYR1_023747 [Brachionus plicatilis]
MWPTAKNRLCIELIILIWRTEGNKVKKLIGVPSRCRTTNLMLSLNIEDSYLENQKVEFILKLIENKYNKNILLKNLESDGKKVYGLAQHIYLKKTLTPLKKSPCCLEMEDTQRDNNLIKNIKRMFSKSNQIKIALVPVESSDAAKLAPKKALSKQSNPVECSICEAFLITKYVIIDH